MSQVDQKESIRVLSRLKLKSPNKVCFDCDTKNPAWASVTYAVYVCLTCSGRHRSLGTHLSFIRSVDMDKWNVEHLEAMKIGGNDKAAKFFASHGWNNIKKEEFTEKYNSRAARLYKKHLEEEVEKILNRKEQNKPKDKTIESKEEVLKFDSAKNLDNLTKEVEKVAIKVTQPSVHLKNLKQNKTITAEDEKKLNVTRKPTKNPGKSSKLTSLTRRKGFSRRRMGDKLSNRSFSSVKSDPDSSGSLYQTTAKLSTSKSQTDFESSDSFQERNDSSLDRFKNSKGISSDMYFNKTTSIQQEQMNRFATATSISSDAFFNKTTASDQDTKQNQYNSLSNSSTAENDDFSTFTEEVFSSVINGIK